MRASCGLWGLGTLQRLQSRLVLTGGSAQDPQPSGSSELPVRLSLVGLGTGRRVHLRCTKYSRRGHWRVQ
jgi:hypothetical protein